MGVPVNAKSFLAAALLIVSGFGVMSASAQKLSIVKLNLLQHGITAEVADTTSARMLGLMHRTHLPENSGMLFIFPESGIHCMWMKNTNIPLSVAFLDVVGSVINLVKMAPETLTPHCSSSASKYALEMNVDWFEIRKIKVGDVVVGIPNLNARR